MFSFWSIGAVVCWLFVVVATPRVNGFTFNNNNGNSKKEGWQEKQEFKTKMLLQKIVANAAIPSNFKPFEGGSRNHHNQSSSGQAVFAAAISPTYNSFHTKLFLKSLRATGYAGDIVLAVPINAPHALWSLLRQYDVIGYEVEVICVGPLNDRVCSFVHAQESTKYSINMLRYYLYQWWAIQYPSSTVIMITDFKDVFFQSNPFAYQTNENWLPSVVPSTETSITYQFVSFQEAYPNKIIGRCQFNAGWIRNCYGKDVLQTMKAETVICSGISFGTRDAMLIYTYVMLQQLDPKVRMGSSSNGNINKSGKDTCISLGMDQGFHNYVLYAPSQQQSKGKKHKKQQQQQQQQVQLQQFMNIKLFRQGDGPVNTIGGFSGKSILVKSSLQQWGILKLNNNNKNGYRMRQSDGGGNGTIHNWDGSVSAVVHQADRFMASELGGDYSELRISQLLHEKDGK